MFYTLLKFENTVFLWSGVHNLGLVYIIDSCSIDDSSKLLEWSIQYNVDINDISADEHFPNSILSSITLSLILLGEGNLPRSFSSSLIDSVTTSLKSLSDSAAGRALLEREPTAAAVHSY